MDGTYRARNGARDMPVVKRPSDGTVVGDDFPSLCEICLGQNPYVRMIKLPYGKKLCKITNSPYQGFRWKAGPDGRFKETIVSFVIAKERNICQCCLNDMQFGLPVGVRDQLLKESSNQQVAMPRSDVGMRYHYEQLSRDSSDGSQQLMSMTDGMNNISKINQLATFSNMKQVAAARHNSTAFRNLPKLCSFWLNGTCGRVKNKSCPFRPCCGTFVFPELASSHKELMAELVASLTEHGADHVQKKMSNDLRAAFRESLKGNKDQAIRKRVYGEDELSSKYLGAMKAARVELEPPADPSVCTLWVGNVDSDEIGEADLGGAFYAFGMVTGVTVVRASRCAFVDFAERASAENAANHLHNNLVVKGHVLSLKWANPRRQQQVGEVGQSSQSIADGLTLDMPAPPRAEEKGGGAKGGNAYFSELANRSSSSSSYPSMDPQRMGTTHS